MTDFSNKACRPLRGLCKFLAYGPGARAPGFTLSLASRAQTEESRTAQTMRLSSTLTLSDSVAVDLLLVEDQGRILRSAWAFAMTNNRQHLAIRGKRHLIG